MVTKLLLLVIIVAAIAISLRLVVCGALVASVDSNGNVLPPLTGTEWPPQFIVRPNSAWPAMRVIAENTFAIHYVLYASPAVMQRGVVSGDGWKLVCHVPHNLPYVAMRII